MCPEKRNNNKKKANKNVSRKSNRIYRQHVFAERRRAHSRYLSLSSRVKNKHCDREKKTKTNRWKLLEFASASACSEIGEPLQATAPCVVGAGCFVSSSRRCLYPIPSENRARRKYDYWEMRCNNWNGIRLRSRTYSIFTSLVDHFFAICSDARAHQKKEKITISCALNQHKPTFYSRNERRKKTSTKWKLMGCSRWKIIRSSYFSFFPWASVWAHVCIWCCLNH